MLAAPGFAQQTPVEFTVATYPLTLPSGHPLLTVLDPRSPQHQPYREAGLIRLAQALAALDRRGTVIDIGANVGDSCAILHRLSNLPILCVEASDFFFPYLEANIARHFAARATAHRAFVVPKPGAAPAGLYHVAGTARPVDQPGTETSAALSMAELLDLAGDTALLKIDVDGMDLGLAAAALAHGTPRYPVYFELELMGETLEAVRDYGAQALALFAQAASAGYAAAYLWDDAGRFYGRLATDDVAALTNALNYLGQFQHRAAWCFDVALVHQDDAALAAALENGLALNAVAPLR